MRFRLKIVSLSLIVAILHGSPQLAGASSYRDLLDRYEGRWIGAFVITSFDGQRIKELKVEQQYWWEGEVQKAIAVLEDEGELSYSHSKITLENGIIYSEITHENEPPMWYIGRVRDQTITWLSTDVLKTTNKQFKETIVEEAGRTVMHTEGFENIIHQGRQVTLVITGKLIKQEDG